MGISEMTGRFRKKPNALGIFWVLMVVSFAECQSSSESVETELNGIQTTESSVNEETTFSSTTFSVEESEKETETSTASPENLTTNEEVTPLATETDSNQNTLQSRTITTGLLRENETSTIPPETTNEGVTSPTTNQNTSPSGITIGLPTVTEQKTLSTESESGEETTLSPEETCGENEVYDCLPLCPRRCSLLSKIVCRKLPTFIRPCHKGCTCRPGYSLDRQTDKCIEHC